MAVQLSTAVRNARLDSVESAIGASAVLKIRTGAAPASCGAADSGTVVATVPLPADWMQNAAAGSKQMAGSWADNSADAAGTAGHWRIYAADGTTCHMQGTISATGGGGDMQLDNVVFAAGQQFTVTQFTLNEANA